jgi:hypothetical protein
MKEKIRQEKETLKVYNVFKPLLDSGCSIEISLKCSDTKLSSFNVVKHCRRTDIKDS